MKNKTIIIFLAGITIISIINIFGSGCAQIGMPTGGPKDTIPPQLTNASPALNTVNFKGNTITLAFNEYIEIQDVQNNVLVSPLPKTNPSVNYKLKTITIKLKDTLLPNTTYSINFGNAIKDINEGNIFKDFTYVFSTGNTIDSLSLTGKVLIAETGKADSTLIALLYKNVNDSSVQKRKPDYIARVNAKGEFNFNNLSAGNFRLYALKDGDGNKYYSSKVEIFAFNNTDLNISSTNKPVTLYAFAEQKENKNPITTKASLEKKLNYTSSIKDDKQDLLNPLELTFNNPIKNIETSKIILTDTNYTPVPNATISLDSNNKKVIVTTKWVPSQKYKLILNKDAVSDSLKNFLGKTDTLSFTAKSEEDYGNIVLRFKSLDLSTHPVLQFVQNDEVKMSYPLTSNEWSIKLFPPGEYELRILLDTNNNGHWDTGNYSKKLQPEKVIPIDQKLSIRPNWDNERDIML